MSYAVSCLLAICLNRCTFGDKVGGLCCYVQFQINCSKKRKITDKNFYKTCFIVTNLYITRQISLTKQNYLQIMKWDVLPNSKSLHTVSHSLATRLNIRNFKHEKRNLLSDLCTFSDKQHKTTPKLKLNVFLRSKPYL